MKLMDEHKLALEIARRETDNRLSRAAAFAREASAALAADESDPLIPGRLGVDPVAAVAEMAGAAAEMAGVAGADAVRDTLRDTIPNMRRLSPAERRTLRVKTASTIAELDAMVIALTDQLAQVAEKIDDLKRHSMASAAYNRWINSSSRG